MLDRIKTIIRRYGTEHSFRLLVSVKYKDNPEGRKLILSALDFIAKSSAEKKRDNGEPAISHPIAVALILMVYLNISIAYLIASALLHDVIEDVKGQSFKKLSKRFGTDIALCVWYMSKDTDTTGLTWEVRTKFAHLKLWNAPRDAQIIKMCDRLHNLLTIEALPQWKRLRTLKDTVIFYLRLSKKNRILTDELLEAIKFASRID